MRVVSLRLPDAMVNAVDGCRAEGVSRSAYIRGAIALKLWLDSDEPYGDLVEHAVEHDWLAEDDAKGLQYNPE